VPIAVMAAHAAKWKRQKLCQRRFSLQACVLAASSSIAQDQDFGKVQMKVSKVAAMFTSWWEPAVRSGRRLG
jgi:asparagine synthetase A